MFATKTGTSCTGEKIPVSRGMQAFQTDMPKLYSGSFLMNINCKGQRASQFG